ncbi:MAG: RluA family pseudouridine synthase [Bdellovibrionales bacterium]|nr:RluA family pseudouridine synthase [Bdellovibrionales bacterium]
MPVVNKSENFIINHELTGLRLDKALATHPQIRTRSRAAKLIQMQKVTLKDQQVKASQIVEMGQTFKLEIPVEASTELTPYDFKLDIFFEDENLIVINKPHGLVVHPAHGHENHTLVNALIHHCKYLSMGFAEKRPGIVHRLDKDTSGLMVAAKNDFAHEALAKQFKAKTVTRRYKAICYSQPRTLSGRIESSLIRHPIHRKKFCSENLVDKVSAKGKWAVTNYHVAKTYKEQISLIYCQLETGRTHQIRIHLSEMGVPIINDPIYLSSSKKKVVQAKELKLLIEKTQRLALHAFELGFVHPTTNEELYFKCNWPKDLQPLVNYLEFEDL